MSRNFLPLLLNERNFSNKLKALSLGEIIHS